MALPSALYHHISPVLSVLERARVHRQRVVRDILGIDGIVVLLWTLHKAGFFVAAVGTRAWHHAQKKKNWSDKLFCGSKSRNHIMMTELGSTWQRNFWSHTIMRCYHYYRPHDNATRERERDSRWIAFKSFSSGWVTDGEVHWMCRVASADLKFGRWTRNYRAILHVNFIEWQPMDRALLACDKFRTLNNMRQMTFHFITSIELIGFAKCNSFIIILLRCMIPTQWWRYRLQLWRNYNRNVSIHGESWIVNKWMRIYDRQQQKIIVSGCINATEYMRLERLNATVHSSLFR